MQSTTRTSNTVIPNDWKSIFIPRIDFAVTRQELVDLIEKELFLGRIERIDFAPANNGSGRMAFIHMIEFNKIPSVESIRNEMEQSGFWEVYQEFQRHPIKLRFVINKNPVPKTTFTMETLADAVARQGYTVEQTTVDMEKINEEIGKQSNLIDHNQQVMDIAITEQYNRMANLESQVAILINRLIATENELAATKLKLEDMEVKYSCDISILYDTCTNHSDMMTGMDIEFTEKFKEIQCDFANIEK
jgi:uncharacterized coiled-coil protein SlyX